MAPLRTLFLAALAARLALAAATSVTPIFPPYYYHDAEITQAAATAIADGWHHRGPPPSLELSRAHRVYATWVACLFYLFGPHPLIPKALNAVIGSAALVTVAAAAAPAVGAGPALAAGWACVLWPSQAFFTSQNFKDSSVLFLCWFILWALTTDTVRARHRAAGVAVAIAALLVLRPYEGLAALCSGAAGLLASLKQRARAVAIGAAVLLAAVTWRPVTAAVGRYLIVSDDARYAAVRPLTPSGLAEIRRLRQESDRTLARRDTSHDIGTQLFPGLRLKSWFDLALFAPKGVFYVLFMPLPGIYPIKGNIGRLAAAAENLGLLVLTALAAVSLGRRRPNPAGVVLLSFFALMALGSALLELDLGAAARHKVVYLPALFPFAMASLAKRRSVREGRLKVLQVLECGGPGGTGNQVVSLCNGLDSKRFEIGLVYSVRPGSDAASFRSRAVGAKSAFFVPDMVREISPWRDARALMTLYGIFRRERPDVVHAHSSKAGVLARWAAWLAGVPRVFYTPHGYGFLQQDRTVLRRLLYKAVEATSSWIGVVVAVSPSEAELAQPLTWGKAVETVCDAYLGELPPTLAPEAHDGIVVGSCGRLTPARNPEAFVNLAQRLTDSRNGLRCVWIGGGEHEERVRRNIENMNLDGRLLVTGWLDSAEAQNELRRLDILVHYSRWDGLPNAVLEAMAHGLPVVAADVPGARDAVVHGETGFLAKTEVDLLEHTLKLVDDPELRRRLGAAGRKRVASLFGHQDALRRLEALYAGG